MLSWSFAGKGSQWHAGHYLRCIADPPVAIGPDRGSTAAILASLSKQRTAALASQKLNGAICLPSPGPGRALKAGHDVGRPVLLRELLEEMAFR